MGRRAYTPEQLDAAFWAKVDWTDKDGCWRWTAAVRGAGNPYPVFTVGGKLVSAHRYALQRWGTGIAEGEEARHLCHTQRCVRPDHLTSGSRLQNERDKDAAERRPRGPLPRGCRKCGGPREGVGRRGDGRTWRFCIPCTREYQRQHHARGVTA